MGALPDDSFELNFKGISWVTHFGGCPRSSIRNVTFCAVSEFSSRESSQCSKCMMPVSGSTLIRWLSLPDSMVYFKRPFSLPSGSVAEILKMIWDMQEPWLGSRGMGIKGSEGLGIWREPGGKLEGLRGLGKGFKGAGRPEGRGSGGGSL